MAKRKEPKFFIIGHPRSGTTSLYEMLKKHPNVFMPEDKEPHFFCKDVNQKISLKKEYLELFSNARGEKAIGEATADYLRSSVSAREIKKFSPNAKIIMILREPVELLRALYQKNIEAGKESISSISEKIFDQDYIEITEYSKQIRRYLDNFPKENIKIIIYDDYKNHNKKTLKGIFEFLGVDKNFVPKKETINNSRFNRFGKLNLILKSQTSVKIRKFLRDSLPKTIIRPLQEIYRNAIYKKGKIEIPEKTKKELKKKLKPEVEKINDLLHEEGFLDKDRDLVKEWDYRK
ncbi:MAG: sulfotransferase [Candidatus Paceibacteria bacterium]